MITCRAPSEYDAIAASIDSEYEQFDSAIEAAQQLAPGVTAEFRRLMLVEYAYEDADPVDILCDVISDRLSGVGHRVGEVMREELIRTLEEGEDRLTAIAAENII